MGVRAQARQAYGFEWASARRISDRFARVVGRPAVLSNVKYVINPGHGIHSFPAILHGSLWAPWHTR